MQNNNNNGGASKHRSKQSLPPLTVPTGHVSFRMLCHVSKIGKIIGRSGSIVKVFQQETGAKIRVEKTVNDSDERLILIIAPENPKKKIILKGLSVEEKGDDEEFDVSPAQEALVKVFDRVLDDDDGETEGLLPTVNGNVSCRLLADTSQIGSVMGKGGQIIAKIRKDSGAKVRVLPNDQLPACASPTDEVIQIMGGILPVKRALVSISRCLQDRPPLDKAQMVSCVPSGTASNQTFTNPRMEFSHRNPMLPSAAGINVDYSHRGCQLSKEGDRISMLEPAKLQQEVSFRLLCSHEKVGGVIGKGGTIVRTLQHETGASISAGAPISESDERVITVSAMENTESRNSAAQSAVLRVFVRSVEVGIEKGIETRSNKSAPVCARLLIPTNQVGCLIGKGGKIVAEMRRTTGAYIRILGGDQLPKCASESDKVVQISGEFGNVQNALFHVTGRLRDNLFPGRVNDAEARNYPSSTIPVIGHYGGVREPQSVGLSHHLDRQATLTQSMDQLGLSHSLDRPPSPRQLSSQTMGGGSPRSIMDVGRGLTSRRGGIEPASASGSKSAIITNTTVEILVPKHVLGSVYGENGSNLNRLRQISGAQVEVQDPRPGTDSGIVIISGTPDQTQAAQSLLHAFIIT